MQSLVDSGTTIFGNSHPLVYYNFPFSYTWRHAANGQPTRRTSGQSACWNGDPTFQVRADIVAILARVLVKLQHRSRAIRGSLRSCGTQETHGRSRHCQIHAQGTPRVTAAGPTGKPTARCCGVWLGRTAVGKAPVLRLHSCLVRRLARRTLLSARKKNSSFKCPQSAGLCLPTCLAQHRAPGPC